MEEHVQKVVDPSSGEVVATYPAHSDVAVERALDAAHEAFRAGRRSSFADRGRIMRRAALTLRERSEAYAHLMATEMGKVLREGRAEVEKCAWLCDYYAEHAESFLAPTPVETDARHSFVARVPLGTLLAVMPWNFPFWQVFRAAVPALMAGNTVLLKHASNVPGCALAIADVFHAAGLTPGAFASLLIDSGRASALLADARVSAVTLTGSTAAGRAIGAKAGEVIKPCVLELGGSDAYVVLHDADVDAAAATCVRSRMINAGQSCIAAKRFVVVDAVRGQFEEACVARMRALRMGAPTDDSADLGPQARADLRDELHDQVVRSVAAGARLLLGGAVPEGAGAFYPPTLLTDVGEGVPAYHEELFGPVASILPARDEAHAIALANDTSFGLGAAVFTRDIARGTHIATHELEAGCAFVNTHVRSDPRLPFGGIKGSGFGRELGQAGIRAFVNEKTVYVAS